MKLRGRTRLLEASHGPLQRLLDFGPKSKPLAQIVAREFAVSQDSTEQTRADRFAGVNGNNGRASIGMTDKVVTAPNPNCLKTAALERCDEILAAERGKRCHALTVTRCTPTKSRLSGASP